MEFNNNKPIYLQVYDSICERVINGELKPGERIPSVREYGIAVGVNPNTMARTYERLSAAGIIKMERGIGYFICDNACEIAVTAGRKDFLEEELPLIVRKMRLLGIGIDAILPLL